MSLLPTKTHPEARPYLSPSGAVSLESFHEAGHRRMGFFTLTQLGDRPVLGGRGASTPRSRIHSGSWGRSSSSSISLSKT
jgi:hypothetical protein